MSALASLLEGFDPDAAAVEGALFGLPFPAERCRIQVIPVPWEATTSYGRGTAHGPSVVLQASAQVDLHDLDFGDVWREGIGLLPTDPRIPEAAAAAEDDALAVIDSGGAEPELAAKVNAWSEVVNDAVYEAAQAVLARGAIPAVLGGDHSAPYGLIRALSERHPGLGVLHIDAHADLRDAYEGFEWSHASIFHNVLKLPGVSRQVGVGWRDVGRAEIDRVHAEPHRIRAFFDRDLAFELARGRTWVELCQRIIDALPEQVYISFDIDGLDPSLCPHTGTPVPGGLSFRDMQVLLCMLSDQREVVGFDLCEVSPGEGALDEREDWDANVGARVLYKLAGCALRSRTVELRAPAGAAG